MSKYTICFDFPEMADPWFPTMLKDGLGFTTSLVNAITYDDETSAESLLNTGYGGLTKDYGTVVEIGT